MDEPDAVHVTLLRHGESESNRSGRWQGQGDSPLSSLGRDQASRAGTRLARRTFDRVISSDLQRAADTARATGFELELDAAFRELDVGSWEGLTREEVQKAYPEEMARLSRGEDVPLGGGETYRAFVQRVEQALRRVTGQMAPGERLLVVCHGGVIGALASVALGIRERGHWPISRVVNTGLTELRVAEARFQLQVFNDDLHLRGMPESEADLRSSGHDVVVHERGPVPEALVPWLKDAPVYGLLDLPRDEAPAGWRAFRGEGTGAEGLEAWLRYAAENYSAATARCLAGAADVAGWLQDSLSLGVGEGEVVAPPLAGTWARLRGGERPVLQRYNAGE